MVIAEKGLDVEVVQIDLGSGEQMTEQFRHINPYCTVPVLELDDGTCLTSSVGCCRYLEEAFPEPPLMGRTPEEKAVIADLDWRMENEGFMAVGEAFRNSVSGLSERALTGPHNYVQIPELGERGKRRVGHFLDLLEQLLADRAYIAGDSFSVADITALCTVDFAGRFRIPLPESALNLKRWHDDVSARASARA